MAESKQTLRLKLAKTRQALHQAYPHIAALAAELAAVSPSVQFIAGDTASPVTPLPAGDKPRTERETTNQPVVFSLFNWAMAEWLVATQSLFAEEIRLMTLCVRYT